MEAGSQPMKEGMQSQMITSARIRVENAIKRLKEYKIFIYTLNNRTNKRIMDDMVIIVSALCNLKQRLIK